MDKLDELRQMHQKLMQHFAQLCSEKGTIESALNNGVADSDKPDLQKRLSVINQALSMLQRRIEGLSIQLS